jgi:S1-C subfamily serine protease
MTGALCPVCDTVAPERAGPGSLVLATANRARLHPRLAAVVATMLVLGGLYAWTELPHSAGTSATVAAVERDERSPSLSATPVLMVNATVTEWDLVQGRPGQAFVVRTSAGRSYLLTDFYLIADRYLAGEHTVTVSDGTRFETGRVMATDTDEHAALVRVEVVLPPLRLAAEPPAPGERVTVRGVDGVSVSGVVLDYPGRGGPDHLAFSAVVPAGLAGAPVMNPSGEVVGMAEQSDAATAADGIGLAVPIADACRAVGC